MTFAFGMFRPKSPESLQFVKNYKKKPNLFGRKTFKSKKDCCFLNACAMFYWFFEQN